MLALSTARDPTRHTGGRRLGGRPAITVLVCMVAVALLPMRAIAHGGSDQPAAHTLTVDVAFPDDGLVEGEQLCLGLFAASAAGTGSPLQLACIGPGAGGATFDGLAHGAYQVVLPTEASVLTPPRYAGQLIETDVPDEAAAADYGVAVQLALSPDFAGTTGTVDVSVYACPPGTDEGGDATAWQTECGYVVGGVALTLTSVDGGVGEPVAAATGEDGDLTGRVEFPPLPAGAYELDGQLPDNVAETSARFVTSNVDATTTVLQPDQTLAVRPAEDLKVDVYLVLDELPPAPAPVAPPPAGQTAPPPAGETAAPPTVVPVPAVPTPIPSPPTPTPVPTVAPQPTATGVASSPPAPAVDGAIDAPAARVEPTFDAQPVVIALPSTGTGPTVERSGAGFAMIAGLLVWLAVLSGTRTLVIRTTSPQD